MPPPTVPVGKKKIYRVVVSGSVDVKAVSSEQARQKVSDDPVYYTPTNLEIGEAYEHGFSVPDFD